MPRKKTHSSNWGGLRGSGPPRPPLSRPEVGPLVQVCGGVSQEEREYLLSRVERGEAESLSKEVGRAVSEYIARLKASSPEPSSTPEPSSS